MMQRACDIAHAVYMHCVPIYYLYCDFKQRKLNKYFFDLTVLFKTLPLDGFMGL